LRIDDAASYCGVSQDLLSRLENGKPVGSNKLMKVLAGLGLSLFAVPIDASSQVEHLLRSLKSDGQETAS
jgi:transcriptional regulator with XRE-family HTH domain